MGMSLAFGWQMRTSLVLGPHFRICLPLLGISCADHTTLLRRSLAMLLASTPSRLSSSLRVIHVLYQWRYFGSLLLSDVRLPLHPLPCQSRNHRLQWHLL